MTILPTHLLEDLKSRYSEPHRHYHTWKHIEALLKWFHVFEREWIETESVIWAIYWHDAVYDPRASDNEDKSAELLALVSRPYLAEGQRRFADSLIRATTRHLVPEGIAPEHIRDVQLFLDIDLSILASSDIIFDAYEINIRSEYKHVPDDAFRKGRSRVLQSFLDRERLFFSDTCFNKWEKQARSNIIRSLKRLSA